MNVVLANEEPVKCQEYGKEGQSNLGTKQTYKYGIHSSFRKSPSAVHEINRIGFTPTKKETQNFNRNSWALFRKDIEITDT